MIKKLFTLLALGFFVTTLAACNTTEGMGEDIEAAGDGIQDAAD